MVSFLPGLAGDSLVQGKKGLTLFPPRQKDVRLCTGGGCPVPSAHLKSTAHRPRPEVK